MFKDSVPVGQKPETKPVKWVLPRLVSSKDTNTQASPQTPESQRSESPLPGQKNDAHSKDPSAVGTTDNIHFPDIPGELGKDSKRDEQQSSASEFDIPKFAVNNVLDNQGQATPSGSAEPAAIDSLARAGPGTPQTEPLQNPKTGTQVPSNTASLPRLPKITVQKPSTADVSGESGPVDLEKLKNFGDISQLTNAAHSSAEPPATPSGIIGQLKKAAMAPNLLGEGSTSSEVPKIAKPSKRVSLKHKTRNALARKTVLKMLLGRRLAGPAKQTLRALAKGEPVSGEAVLSLLQDLVPELSSSLT